MTSTLNLARVATFAAHRHQPRVLSNAAPSRAVAFENLSRARRHAHSRARAIIERAATEDEDVAEDAADGPGAAPAASASDAADEASSPRRAATSPNCFDDTTAIDDELSNRWIDLDPAGYFLIAVDADAGVIRAAHFLNLIDDDGKACDPVTGEVIPCDGSYTPKAHKTFEGRTAKELSVRILEEPEGEGTVTMLVHANYLGREFQRAETCLREGSTYVQD